MSFRLKSIASATSEKPPIARGLFDKRLITMLDKQLQW